MHRKKRYKNTNGVRVACGFVWSGGAVPLKSRLGKQKKQAR